MNRLKICLLLSFVLAALLIATPVEAAQSKTDKTNIICIWTDKQKLKALTIMTFDSISGKVGILSVPLFTHLDINGHQTTIEALWNREGRAGVSRRLAELLEITIDGQITFDQPVIEQASGVIGPFEVKGHRSTLLQAFEDTRTERRKDDQDVLRAIAANIISPGGLTKVPKLLWLFTTQVDTNIHPELMLQIYRVMDHQGPTILTKKALRGRDYYQDGYRYRYVEPATWKSIMHEISA
ncbi:hypothetical protein Desca_1983 [Desulfotomaculum nigrificans CO-1-SRB]|uniref:Cell envelope-related transcriptional attenuator n=1 Tax=Desulfotomaculum nigrificans (strain DSM 14880 / VKM B-2319 / CO-1-SRB) TaxID=868595 RepID=F6B952_DESCC|nr:hypothetical protein [Desulfotomaculum nigrificans]AEF94824.1 hypothetical protein Desca_1983 [Desulfotomaculum nigrificans CO-1-SRB]